MDFLPEGKVVTVACGWLLAGLVEDRRTFFWLFCREVCLIGGSGRLVADGAC